MQCQLNFNKPVTCLVLTGPHTYDLQGKVIVQAQSFVESWCLLRWWCCGVFLSPTEPERTPACRDLRVCEDLLFDTMCRVLLLRLWWLILYSPFGGATNQLYVIYFSGSSSHIESWSTVDGEYVLRCVSEQSVGSSQTTIAPIPPHQRVPNGPEIVGCNVADNPMSAHRHGKPRFLGLYNVDIPGSCFAIKQNSESVMIYTRFRLKHLITFLICLSRWQPMSYKIPTRRLGKSSNSDCIRANG